MLGLRSYFFIRSNFCVSSIYPPPGALYYPPPGAPMTSYDVTYRAPGGGEREWTPVAVNHSSRTVTSYDVIGRQEEGREGRYIFCTCRCHAIIFLTSLNRFINRFINRFRP